MDLKKLATRKMLTAYAALATMVGASGCAGTEQWAQQNQGNMALWNTGLNTVNTGWNIAEGITGIVQNKDRNDALDKINDTIEKNNNRRPQNQSRPQRPGPRRDRGGRGGR